MDFLIKKLLEYQQKLNNSLDSEGTVNSYGKILQGTKPSSENSLQPASPARYANSYSRIAMRDSKKSLENAREETSEIQDTLR